MLTPLTSGEATTLNLTALTKVFMQAKTLSSLFILCALGCDSDAQTNENTPSESSDMNMVNSTVDMNANNTTVDMKGSTMNTSTNAVTADFHTPAVIVDLLALQRDVSWTTLQELPTNLTRFSMGPGQGSTDVVSVEDTQTSVSTSLIVQSSLAQQSTGSANNILRAMFQFVQVEGGLRIMSVKHPMYALDANGSDVVLSDVRSVARANDAGYLLFQVNKVDDLYTLEASARYVWNSGSGQFEQEATWTPQPVKYEAGKLTIGGTATAFTLYAPLIDFDLPTDMNPDSIGRVSNAEFLARDKGTNLLDTLSVSEKYAPQIAARGSDESTALQAASMLQEIESDLKAEGASMRYPAQFYLTLREGMLARMLVSADSFDGKVGQRSVPYVYFTNEMDASGAHHPFMVIATYGVPDSLSLFWDIPRPPGDGRGGRYEDQTVTRIVQAESYLVKIPLKNYGNVSSLTENVMVGSLAGDRNVMQFDHHNYASVSATGVAIDGVPIYPSYNNRLRFAQEEAELSTQGMHAGRGLDAHYHSDAYSAQGNGLHLYNDSDYVGREHPPIISIGFDGIAGYGIYKEGGQANAGQDVLLDEYGGHEHGAYNYHYHSFSKTETTDKGTTYTTHMFPPRGAWAGRINDIPDFWQSNRPDYSNNMGANKWVGRD